MDLIYLAHRLYLNQLKLGMNRYGFNTEDLNDVLILLQENPQLKVKTCKKHGMTQTLGTSAAKSLSS